MATHGLALHSTHWWRVAPLKPRLRGHVQIHRHAYRGQPWYVVEDRVAGKFYRFNLASYRIIDQFDGRHTLEQIWQRTSAELGEQTPSQEDVVRLLGQLHAADLLRLDVTPDMAELLERGGKEKRRRLLSRYANPVALRFPLLDPDRLLGWLAGVLKPLEGRAGLALWLVVVLPALLLVPSHWPDLTENFAEQWLAADNLLVMALVFPLLKACHELGHGLAVKRRGGEVHEMGVMLLVFFPIPYVDASAASAFADKRDRMLVGAAGMLTEIFLAALAFYAWLLLEPGFARSLAYNAVVLGSVTTIVFNANPLLRYDGYFVLQDAIEIPNLGQRANRLWLKLIERRLFGVPPSEEETDRADEKPWLYAYAPAALVFRLVVTLGIALFIATEYFFFGVAMAIFTVTAGVLWPLGKGLVALFREPRFVLRATRVRAVLAAVAAGLAIVTFVLPVPYHTQAEGVVWLPEEAILRADASGFVSQVLARSGERIEPGRVLVTSVDPALAARLAEQSARLEQAQARLDAAWGVEPARAGQLQETVASERAALARLQDEASRLSLRARVGGELLMDRDQDLPQRYVRKGEVLGYLVDAHTPVLRVVVPQHQVDAVRLTTREVEVKLPQSLDTTWPGRLVRSVPKAAQDLPSAALGPKGGGDVAVDPGDRDGLKTLESWFEFEVELPREAPTPYLGSRAYVRFAHPPEPLGWRMLRALRRLFLSHFDW